MRVACGLVVAALAAVAYGLTFGAHNARAGTPSDWQAAQTVAVPAPTAVLYPTNVAPATAQAAAPEVKSAQMVVDDQTAGAQTTVTQQQPTNVVVSIRIDSPGDNGPISQTNEAVGAANGTNDAATNQGGAAGGAGQNASTNQQAGAGTTVTQDGAGNYVVSVRINSPGNDGPVSQTNAALGSSNAQNSSETSQGGGNQAPAKTVAPAKAAGGASKHASRRRPLHRSAALAAPRREPAAAAGPAPTWNSSGATATGTVRAAHHPRHAASARAAHLVRTAAPHGSRQHTSASPLGEAVSSAGDLLGSVTPAVRIGATQEPVAGSSSVLYSLLAVLGITAVFVGWSTWPMWRRQRRFEYWRLR